MRCITSVDDIKSLGTILSVWAHPDDETYMAGGLLAAAVRNGQKVICVTATKGEAGVQDDKRWPTKELAKTRSQELEQALDILGVKAHYWLGCKDGCCDEIQPDVIKKQLTTILNKESPDTIITFGPDGWTGHPDHIAVSEWVSFAAADNNIPIYHVVQTPETYEKYLKEADEKLNIFFNIDHPLLMPREECDICFDVPQDLLQLKSRALLAMPSQTQKMFESLGEQFVQTALGTESFSRFR